MFDNTCGKEKQDPRQMPSTNVTEDFNHQRLKITM